MLGLERSERVIQPAVNEPQNLVLELTSTLVWGPLHCQIYSQPKTRIGGNKCMNPNERLVDDRLIETDHITESRHKPSGALLSLSVRELSATLEKSCLPAAHLSG